MQPEGATPGPGATSPETNDRRLVTGEIPFGINAEGLTLYIRPNTKALEGQGLKRVQLEHVLARIVEAGNITLRNGNGAGEGREFVLELKTTRPEPAETPDVLPGETAEDMLENIKREMQAVIENNAAPRDYMRENILRLARAVTSLATVVETQLTE